MIGIFFITFGVLLIFISRTKKIYGSGLGLGLFEGGLIVIVFGIVAIFVA